MPIRHTLIVAALAVLGAACGGGAGGSIDQQAAAPLSSSPSSSGSPPTTGRAAGPNEIPDAVVRDVATGAEVNIRSLAPAAEPILFWFYAPH